MYEDIICGCSLFAGLDDRDLQYALRFFDAASRRYSRGQLLNRPGAPLPRFGLVLDGNVQVYMYDIDGNPMIMAGVHPGDTFGESLCYLQCETAVCITAVTDCSVLWMDTACLKRPDSSLSPLQQALSRRFTTMLAQRTLDMNNRIQILSKLSLRDKLLTYFTQCTLRYKSHCFQIPLSRSDMAIYLGADRSALSRELSRMQREGLIRYHRNQFEIIAHIKLP